MPDAKSNPRERIADLRKQIAHHDALYYKEAAPQISDFEYDLLKQELVALEEKYPELATDESPTKRVGDDRLEGFATYRHRRPMLSLDNTYSRTELMEFDTRLRRALGQPDAVFEYLVEPKIDGLAISITYENGKFVRAVTRGNGVEGDDVTRNLTTFKSLPLQLKGARHPPVMEVRGEVYMTRAEFERINAERAAADLPLYMNPRNLTSGTIKQLDPAEVARRNLCFAIHGFGYVENPPWKRQSEAHAFFEEWGLPVVDAARVAKGPDAVWQEIEAIDKLRHELLYETDGAVVKLDDIALQEQAGYTSKSPRWAMAYKYAPEQAETVLEKITIQVGRTGALTPVANLRPVLLAGTTVQNASLHNADEIARKDIREGDWVVVQKAGEIIPQVIAVKKEKRSADSMPFVFPTHCPECQTKAVRNEDEVVWRCPNYVCPPKVRRRLEHFASKGALDIEGLGEAVVQQIVEKSLATEPADIYKLTYDQLLSLDKFGDKSARNLITAIEASKTAELWRVINGLGIPDVGAQTAKDLARRFGSLEALMDASAERLQEVNGVGKEVAASIRAYFENPEQRVIVERLLSVGLKPTPPPGALTEEGTMNAAVFGKSFVLTGTLPTLSRDEAAALIEAAGGRVASSVSKKTDYVVAGESAGSKLEKAEQLDIKILDESSLRALLSQNDSSASPKTSTQATLF